MHMIAAAALFALAASPNLLANPDFAEGTAGWRAAGEAAFTWSAEPAPEARITVEAGGAAYPQYAQEVPAAPGDLFEMRALARIEEGAGGFGAYLAIEFIDAGKRRVGLAQSSPAFLGEAPCPIRAFGVAPPGTAAARATLILNGRGRAAFREATLLRREAAPAPPLREPVTLRVTGETASAEFLGFGFEDDGWFFNDDNAAHGVDAEDIALREARIRWMRPDWVRMFFWHRDWNPSGDWETFDFDTPNMRSHYRTLDLYEELGATVNVTGVEWGMRAPYADVPAAARAIGALFEHLIRDRGYACVRQWTLSNEPNLGFTRGGASFEDYIQLHLLVREEFARRGLEVAIAGSDDANGGLPWFEACAGDPRYFDAVDFFVSHRYIQRDGLEAGPMFMAERLDLLGGRKPFAVAEFGFHDERSGTLENPLMETHDYAVWTTDFALRGLNLGVAGFNIWCLHEMHYPNGAFMNYGLWNFKDRDWSVRPVYHAWSMLTRHTRAGDRVVRCETSHPLLQAALVGGTLFWVNQHTAPLRVSIEGFAGRELRRMCAETLSGDRETGVHETLDGAEFTAPARGFGYLRVEADEL